MKTRKRIINLIIYEGQDDLKRFGLRYHSKVIDGIYCYDASRIRYVLAETKYKDKLVYIVLGKQSLDNSGIERVSKNNISSHTRSPLHSGLALDNFSLQDLRESGIEYGEEKDQTDFKQRRHNEK